jgi:DNA-binding NarL/FixJ family response regulator
MTELTRRQEQVLQFICDGARTSAIALRLGISVKTVESHRAELMRRARVRSLVNLLKYAIRTGRYAVALEKET